MQIQQANGPVQSVGAAGTSGSFSIAMNGKAFRVLSDTLYQDKIGSIMREISCNALDSHIMAGIPKKPFSLHLPDRFEPWVSFRDYGIGLSPESVQNVFCVYFQSTKDQSNDAVGAFGLGAKTPFAYTDQFNVTSIFEGQKYMYSAFINGEGIPEIQLMAQTATDDSNGVEIKMGVEPKDFNAFIAAARKQLSHFPVKPEVTNYNNGTPFVFEDVSGAVLFENESIKIFKGSSALRPSVHVIQGPVGYPLDVSQVVSYLDNDDAKFLRTISEIGAYMYFDIGEIGVTASREGVEYKGITLDSIKTRIKRAHMDVIDWVNNQIKSLSTVYEQALFLNTHSTIASLVSGLAMNLAPAHRGHSGSYYFTMSNLSVFQVDVTYDVSGTQSTQKTNGVSITKYTSNGMGGFSGSRTATDDVALLPTANSKVVIVLRDTTKGSPLARMRHYFKENKVSTMLSINPKYDNLVMDDAFIDALKDALGGFTNIIRVSEMSDPPRENNARSRAAAVARPTAYLAPSNGHMVDMESAANWQRVYTKLDKLEDSSGKPLKRAVYLEVDRQRTESFSTPVKTWYKQLCRAEVNDLPVYGIRSSDVEKLASSDIEWISLADYVNAKRTEIINNPMLTRYSLAETIISIISSVLGHRFDDLEGLNPRSKLARLMRLNEKAQAVRDALSVNTFLLRIAEVDVSNHPARTVVYDAAHTVFDETPMLRYVARSGYGSISGDEATHIVDYINMCYDKA